MFSRPFLVRVSALWVALLIVGSFLPPDSKVLLGTETNSNDPVVQHRTKMEHRWGHLGGFGIAALLLAVLARNRTEWIRGVIGILALGCLLEVLQLLIYHGQFEYWDVRDDVCADLVGSVLGAWKTVRCGLLKKEARASHERRNDTPFRRG